MDSLNAALSPVAAGRATARISGDRADILLDVTDLPPAARDALEADVRAAALAQPGIVDVRVLQTSERRRRRLIAVASGKGGVGKSTVSANLARALFHAGEKVGLVDADIYGPSQPRILGVEGVKPQARDNRLIPVRTPFGIPLLSMGGLVAQGQAIAWRGSMASGALLQLLEGDWAGIDTLILDLPPGTGDVQLTMVQKHKPDGAVIVTTPQDLALIDATRAIDLFRKVDVPVIGLVENMAGYQCPHCGEISDPFGTGGAEAAAERLGIPFLGRIPLDIAIRTASDAGTPAPEDAFTSIAGRVRDWMAK